MSHGKKIQEIKGDVICRDSSGKEHIIARDATYVVGGNNDALAQAIMPSIWYVVANALAEAALARPDLTDAELDRTCGRGNEGS